MLLTCIVHWRGDFGYGVPEEVRSLHLWRSVTTGKIDFSSAIGRVDCATNQSNGFAGLLSSLPVLYFCDWVIWRHTVTRL